jgi:hypothetical protein
MEGGDQPFATTKGNEGMIVESVESAELPTMHRDRKRGGERCMKMLWSVFNWEDGHEAQCVLSLEGMRKSPCGGVLVVGFGACTWSKGRGRC